MPAVAMATRAILSNEEEGGGEGGRPRVKWGRNNFLNVQEPNWNFNPLSQAPANKAHS